MIAIVLACYNPAVLCLCLFVFISLWVYSYAKMSLSDKPVYSLRHSGDLLFFCVQRTHTFVFEFIMREMFLYHIPKPSSTILFRNCVCLHLDIVLKLTPWQYHWRLASFNDLLFEHLIAEASSIVECEYVV